MRQFLFTVTDPTGIHARPAGLLVKEASKYQSSIQLGFNGKTVNAKRLFAVMGLGAKNGDTLTITVDGTDESEAEMNLQSFLKNNL